MRDDKNPAGETPERAGEVPELGGEIDISAACAPPSSDPAGESSEPNKETPEATIKRLVRAAEPIGITHRILVADALGIVSLKPRALGVVIERLLSHNEIHETGSKKQGTLKYRIGPKPITPEGPAPYTWSDLIGDPNKETGDNKWFLPSRHTDGPPRPVVIVTGTNPGPWYHQALQHMADRGYYAMHGEDQEGFVLRMVQISHDEFRKDGKTGQDRKQPKRIMKVPETILNKKIRDLFEFYTTEKSTVGGPDILVPISHQIPGSPVYGWAKDLLEVPQYPELPLLKGIAEFRFYTEDGVLVHAPGYSELAQTIYAPRDAELPLPELPSDPAALALKAQALAGEVLGLFDQFPWETDADLAAYFSLIITATMRPALPVAPLYGIDATTAGSGKTMLAHAAAIIATGKDPHPLPWKGNEEEREKTLNSSMLTPSTFLFMDNVDSPLGGSLLESILTSSSVDLRRLGGQVVEGISTRKTFVATGNGLNISGDMHRRILMIRLTPAMENPEERSDLKIKELIEVVKTNARELNARILAVCEAYRIAGRPAPSVPITPYNTYTGEWTRYVRNLCLWLGLNDPCDTRARVKAKDDTRSFRVEMYRALIKRAHVHAATKATSGDFPGLPAATIAAIKEIDGIIPEDMLERSGKAGPEFAKALMKMVGKVTNIGPENGDGPELPHRLEMRKVLGRALFSVTPVVAKVAP